MAPTNESSNNTNAENTPTETKKKDEEELEPKEWLKEAIKTTTSDWSFWMYPFGNMVHAKHWIITVIWIIIWLGSTVYGVYSAVVYLIGYFQYVTTVSVTFGTEKPIQFPAVTICNLNPFYFDSAADLAFMNSILTANNLGYAVNASGNNLNAGANSDDTTSIIDGIVDALRKAISTNTSLTDMDRKQFGFGLDSYMLVSCSFNGIQCSEQNFSWFWSYDYGNCYTFNSGRNSSNATLPVSNTSRAGSNYGLVLELLVGDPNLMQFSYNSGIYLTVHNKSDNVKAQGLESGINLQTGYETYVSITRSFNYKLAAPYSTCIDTWTTSSTYGKELFNYATSLNFSTDYDQAICVNICQQDQTIKNCSCMDPQLPSIKSMSFCTSTNQTTCLSTIKKNFANNDLTLYCQDSCPKACSTIEYKLDTSMASYPSPYYTQILNTSSDFLAVFPLNDSTYADLLNQCILKVIVNYNDLTYEVISESSFYGINDVMGIVGGNLIGFSGFSFLSLVLILELIIDYILVFREYYQRKKKAQENEKYK